MEYSNLIAMSRGLVLPCPTSPLLAAANGNCLDVYDQHTLALQHTTTTADAITHLCWGGSPDLGPLLAAASTPSNSVVVVRADTGRVVLDVHDSPVAPASLRLTARGHLLLAAEHGLSLTIIHVERARRVAVLPFVKLCPASRAALASVDPDARAVAIVTRKNAVDGLCVVCLDTGRRTMARRGPDQMAGIRDVAGVEWTRAGILLWGAAADPLRHHAIALLTKGGRVLMSGDPASPAAFRMGVDCVAAELGPGAEERHDAPGEEQGCALGIDAVACCKDGSLLAIGGRDGRLRIVNAALWLQLACVSHATPEVDDTAPPVIFRERTKAVPCEAENASQAGNVIRDGAGDGAKDEGSQGSYFEVVMCSGAVEISKRLRSVSRRRQGVSFAAFSACGGLLASRCDRAGNVVLVWDVRQLRLLAVLILEQDARCVQWSGEGDDEDGDEAAQLAIVCGGEYVYLWRRGGAAAVRVRPAQRWRGGFGARKVAWGKGNGALVVSDGVSAKAFLAVYPVYPV